jgi:hypothetical protein
MPTPIALRSVGRSTGLDQHAAARGGEFDVVRLPRSRLTQSLGEGVRKSRQQVFRLVMLVDRQSIEAGERLVHADEAQLPVAESQTDGDTQTASRRRQAASSGGGGTADSLRSPDGSIGTPRQVGRAIPGHRLPRRDGSDHARWV